MTKSNTLHKYSTPKEFLERNPMSLAKFYGEIKQGGLIGSYPGTKLMIREDHEAEYQKKVRTSLDPPDKKAEWRKWRAEKAGKASAKARAEAAEPAKPAPKAARHRVPA